MYKVFVLIILILYKSAYCKIYLCVFMKVNKKVKMSYTFSIIILYMNKHIKNKIYI